MNVDERQQVYFLKPIDFAGPVKIGCTIGLQDRMRQINIFSPFPLEIAAVMSGGFELERRFHAKFLASRAHGEWFNWSPEMERIMADVRAGTLDIDALPAPLWIHPGRGRPAAPSAFVAPAALGRNS